jgi:tRNA (guanine37-N1)-methyltransferase
MVQIEVLTLFPPMVTAYVSQSIVGKAREKGLIEITTTDIRAFATNKHRNTDDTPYGGGAGMVMQVEPMVLAIEAAKARLPQARVVSMSPKGATLTQHRAHSLVQKAQLILLCGRYEGIDERVMSFVDEELSIGDYVLTGGELAALVVIDAVARLIPGVLGNSTSASTETFESNLLEYPQYTRPVTFRGMTVPAVLQGGDHQRIARWRRWHALHETRVRRPDLFARAQLSDEDRELLLLSLEDLER